MSNGIVTQGAFQDALRKRIMESFMDLVPAEKLDGLIDVEIKAFFETEQLLTVKNTEVEVENPAYEPGKSGYGYSSSSRTLKRECLAFGSKMTPFRQMVWTALHEHLAPKLKAHLEAEHSDTKQKLDEWLSVTAQPGLDSGKTSLFTQLSMGMSNMMLSRIMADALQTAHYNMMQSMNAVGLNITSLPQIPPVSTHPR